MSTRLPITARRLLAVLAGVLMVGGCRVDTEVEVRIGRDGSGSITVTASADAELVRAAPELIDGLATDDLEDAGWVVQGPTMTDDGGLVVVAEQVFSSPDEANRLLDELDGPTGPFASLELVQDASRTRITTSLFGSMLVTGPENFADAGLIQTLNGVPIDASLDERGLTFADAFGLTLRLDAPGEVAETTGRAAPYDEAAKNSQVDWIAEVGAGAGDEAGAEAGQPIDARLVLDDEPARLAARLRDFSLWALPAWVVFFAFVVLPVRFLRRRRSQSR